jgi:hypothetical protein
MTNSCSPIDVLILSSKNTNNSDSDTNTDEDESKKKRLKLSKKEKRDYFIKEAAEALKTRYSCTMSGHSFCYVHTDDFHQGLSDFHLRVWAACVVSSDLLRTNIGSAYYFNISVIARRITKAPPINFQAFPFLLVRKGQRNRRTVPAQATNPTIPTRALLPPTIPFPTLLPQPLPKLLLNYLPATLLP